MYISRKEARRLFLERQGLLYRNTFGHGKQAVARAIDRIAWLQIDTISVVLRAHEHILTSRVENHAPVMLHRLHSRDRFLFEYWSHAAAYLPMSDYRFCLPVMEGSRKVRPPDRKLAPEILRRIETEGPLSSRDFESPAGRKSTGWWDWKPAKRTLEQLFLCGDLMVSHRAGFQKVYDLRERILPPTLDTRMPTMQEWCTHLVKRMIQALGIASEYDIGYASGSIRRLSGHQLKPGLRQAINRLVEEGEICAVDVEGTRCYSTDHCLARLPLRLGKREVRILSPFDNLLINRRRTLTLFGFDYQLECYVPAAKRKFGYFCLPLLYGDELVGRMDAKAHRKDRVLQINGLFLEPDLHVHDGFGHALAKGIQRFAAANDCTAIRLAGDIHPAGRPYLKSVFPCLPSRGS